MNRVYNHRKILLLLLIAFICSYAQDSLEIKYSIIGMKFYQQHDVIKVKVPNWLTSSQLMDQLKRVVLWPGDPPPRKKTYIYAFKETDQIGDTSKNGCIYLPNKGFIWNLDNWEPELQKFIVPSDQDLLIYNTLTDSLMKTGLTLNNEEIRTAVANKFNISTRKLDSIYVRVKYWWEKRSK